MLIPNQLKEARFIHIAYGTKACKVVGWQQPENQLDYATLSAIEKTNYGVVAGPSNLCLIDVDEPNDPKVKEMGALLPPTFTVTTGKGEHRYFSYIGAKTERKSFKEDKNELVSIRMGNSYVVGPGSRHPDGRDYVVLDDVPIAPITDEQLDAVIALMTPQEAIAPIVCVGSQDNIAPTGSEPVIVRDAIDEAIYRYNIYNVMDYFGVSPHTTINPIHGSTTGQNWSIKDNEAHCWRCNTHLGPMELFALLASKCDCNKAESFCRGKDYFTTKKLFLSAFRDCKPKKEVEQLFTSDMLNLSAEELEKQSKSVNLINRRFLASQKSLLLAADSGAGKTTLILQLLIAWALGKEALGFYPHRRLRFLYLGNEDDCLIIQSLFKASLKMANLSDAELKEACDNITIPDTYDWNIFDLEDKILSEATEPYDVVVINPMSNYIDEDLNSSMAPQKFYSQLDQLQRKHNVATIVVGHNNKSGQIAGNKGFENKFRHAITITRVSPNADVFRMDIKKGYSAAGFKVRHIKYNDLCPEHFYWLPVEEKNVPSDNAMTENTKKVIIALPFGPVENMSISEIVKHTNIARKTVSNVLKPLVAMGVVVKEEDSYPAVYNKPSSDPDYDVSERQNARVASRRKGQ